MARQSKSSKGPTPKKGSARHEMTGGTRTTERAKRLHRYTAPTPSYVRKSPPWYGYMLLGLALLGILQIVLNYMSLLPGSVSGWYLVSGILFLGSAFWLSTRWH